MIESGWQRLRRIFRRSVRDEVEDEVAFHMDMRIAEFMAAGIPREEAERRAREQFGNVSTVSDGLVRIGNRRRRRLGLREFLDATLLDLRFGARFLRAHRGFSLTTILTLAIGIGATTAIFSVVNAVLLRPLPYRDADRLVVVTQDMKARGVVDGTMSLPDVEDLRKSATLFEGFATFLSAPNYPFSVDSGPPEALTWAVASTNIFDVLGVPIVYGRNFRPSDGAPNAILESSNLTPGAAVRQRPLLGIIGYDYWRRRFHGDSSVIGRSLVGPYGPTLIIGVVSPNAEVLFPPRIHLGQTPDIWQVLQRDARTAPRFSYGYRVIGRMKPRVAFEDARAQVDSVSRELDRLYPQRDIVRIDVRTEQMHDYLVNDAQPALYTLMGAVLCVLLIACANVAGLLLVRAAHRERELVVRAAIGGSPWRIVRQLLGESATLAVLAGVLGVLIAKAALAVLLKIAPPTLPRVSEIGIDSRVLAFAIAVTTLSVLLFGLGPAVRAATPRLADALRGNARTPSLAGAPRLRHAVVVAEVALSFVLLVGCGLMIRSFVTLLRADLGFDPHGLLTFTLGNRNFKLGQDRVAYVHQVRDTLANIPGVQLVSIATNLPLDGGAGNATWGTTEAGTDRTAFHQAAMRATLPSYFETLRIPLLAGRTFREADDSVDNHVIVVDEVIARQAYGRLDVVGKRLAARNTVYTIVGVVRHQRQFALVGDERGVIYFPWITGSGQAGRWALRTDGDPMALAGSVRAAIASIPIGYQSNTRVFTPGSTQLLINELQPMTAFVDRALAPTRFALMLIGIFAVIAAILAAVGLYVVLASSVRQRTSEIGVRMAFGAQTSDIFSLVIGHGLRLSVVGVLVGVALALATTRVLVGLLVGVRPTDPLTFAAMTVVFLTVATLACWLPARRAAALDPNVALREDAA